MRIFYAKKIKEENRKINIKMMIKIGNVNKKAIKTHQKSTKIKGSKSTNFPRYNKKWKIYFAKTR